MTGGGGNSAVPDAIVKGGNPVVPEVAARDDNPAVSDATGGRDTPAAFNATDLPLISVIVPIYNSEAYLPQCLESIIGQTYRHLEVILVDDGSTDGSGVICERYAERDRRLRVCHTANRGASAARNLALAEASGELVGFVDSDDCIAADMYEHLFGLLLGAAADVAQVALMETATPDAFLAAFFSPEPEGDALPKASDAQATGMQGGSAQTSGTQVTGTQTTGTSSALKPHARRASEGVALLEGDDILINYLSGSNFSLQTRLHRRELFAGFVFHEGRINEDIVAGYQTLSRARRMVASDVPRYFYRINRQGVTNSPLRPRDFDLFCAYEQLVALAATAADARIYSLARARQRRAPFTLLIKMALYGTVEGLDEQATQRQLRARLRPHYGFLMRSPMPVNRKLLLTLVCLSYRFTRWLARRWLGTGQAT
jgi:hypothetical protein